MSDYIVVKCGGSMLNQLNDVFFECIKKLQQKYKVVIVHGGGPEIDAKLKDCNINVEKRDGLRITPKEVMDVVQMVLCGSTNKKFVMNLQKHNLLAVGCSGCDGNLLQVQPVSEEIGICGRSKLCRNSLIKRINKYGVYSCYCSNRGKW